jgi:hypothetical protein
MKSILVVTLLTILRIGVPSILLLSIGEAVKNRYNKIRYS